MSTPEGTPAGPAELPADLLELAAERLLGLTAEPRQRALEELVRAHPTAEAALRRLARDLAGVENLLDDGFTAPEDPAPALGPYRVQRILGEGAFGIVYLCTQDEPIRREVAVKVLRPGAGDKNTLARFGAERYVLATLNHPAIAQVYDAGALADGRPYFVMEYVRGLPITTWCDRSCLDVDARLALFVRLCQGVQHAHAKGIVHRDLKPANVLVFEQEGQPRPKIIDFGIAKALRGSDPGSAASATPIAIRTDTGRVIGTPGYMSPEQSAGGGEVDARADVFSLGVMLYELLTGQLPWGRRPETTDQEPPRPSARVASDTTGDAARVRALAPHRLASRLRGDLDWIVLKALARDRGLRYSSAQDLADDVERHQRGEAVLAGPPGLGYRLRKLAGRHRVALGAAALVIVITVLGVGLSLRFRAEARSRVAEVEAAAAGLLARANDPRIVNAPRSDALRKALVQDALVFYEKFLKERPAEPKLRLGRIQALWTLSEVHWLVGEYAQSEAVAQETASEAEALLAAAPDDLGRHAILGAALCNLGRASSCLGKGEAAAPVLDRAVEELERCHAADPSAHADQLATTLMQRASLLADVAECVSVLRRVVTIREDILGARPTLAAKRYLLDALGSLGEVLLAQDDLQGATRVLRRADNLLDATPDAGAAPACRVLGEGAALAMRKGNHTAAVQRLEKAIAIAKQWSEQEPTWPRPLAELYELRYSLAQQLQVAGSERDAANAVRAAIATGEERTTKFPDDALARGQFADQLSSFANSCLASGRRDGLGEAETWARRALALLETIPPSVDEKMRVRARAKFMARLGLILDARGSGEARQHWERTSAALTASRERFGVHAEGAPLFLEAVLRVARQRVDALQEDRAREALDAFEAVLREHPRSDRAPWKAAEACWLRALVAARRGDHAGAAAAGEKASTTGAGWRSMLLGAEALRAAWLAARTPEPAGAALAHGYRDRGIELYRVTTDALREDADKAPADPWIVLPLAQARARLAELLLDRGEREDARALLDAALPVLAEMRDVAHANLWDEDLYRGAQANAR